MSHILIFIAGVSIGGSVGWLIALRFAGAQRPMMIPPVPEDLLASETASQLAANTSAESAFEPLAALLIERCAVRVLLPCALVMRERVGAAAHILSVAGGLDSRLVGIEVPLDSAPGRAITDGIPVVGDPDEKVVSIDRRDRRRYSGGGVAVPVAQAGQVWGAVLAFGEPPAGAADAVDALGSEVKKFAPVLIPAYAAMVAARRAETDELTGLANRRAFNGVLSRNHSGDRAALIVFDIDHFKDVNDSLGHAAGDAALRHVARLLKSTLRPKDSAARIGGEEFAVWLPNATLELGHEIAERLRQSIEDSPFRFSGNERTITVSCGVAAYPKPTSAVENLLALADAAMYQAKRAGRNRVVANNGTTG